MSRTALQTKPVEFAESQAAANGLMFRPLVTAGDIMTEDVRILTPDHRIKDYIRFMQTHRVRHAPVVDDPLGTQQPYFVGVISERDILRQAVPDGSTESSGSTDHKTTRKLLGQIMTRNPASVSPQTPVSDAIAAMLKNHVDMLPVLEKTRIVGIITTTDILRIYWRLDYLVRQLYPELEGKMTLSEITAEKAIEPADKRILLEWVFQPVSQIMTTSAVCLQRNDTVSRAMDIMQKNQFRHVAVVDRQGRLEGLISDRDILRQLPFAGRRPAEPETIFRQYLFSVLPNFRNLKTELENIMIPAGKVLTAGARTSTTEAARILRTRKISCLPVVEENRIVTGIVTVTDIMRAVLAGYRLRQAPGR